MKKTKRFAALLVALAMALTMLAGCGGSGSSSPAAQPADSTPAASSAPQDDMAGLTGVENELTMKLEGEVDPDKVLTTLIDCDATPAFNGNPYDDVAGANWSIQPFMFDYLAFFSSMPERKFELSLMDSYTYENQVLTIKLLDGLKWSDGSALDAEDLMTNYYCDLNSGSLWNYLDGIEKVDDLTVKLTFSQESPLLLNIAFNNPIRTPNEIYGDWAAQYKDVAENMRVYDEETLRWKLTDEGIEKAAEIKQDLLTYKPAPDEVVCSGPYVISNYNTSEILFTVNPEYRKEPLVRTIRGLRPGDSQAFASAILAGEYTMENGGLNVDMSNQIDSYYQDTMRKIFVPEFSSVGYSFNTNVYPLDQLEVRQAICMALDRASLLAVAEPGSFVGSEQNAGLLPSLEDTYTNPGFVDTLTSYDYDPDAAAALLESIGWKKDGGKWVDANGESPVISIATISTWPSFFNTGEAMSQMLTDFGLNIDFKPMEFGVWNDFTKSDEKMMSCTFIAAASSYAYPWECFNDLFNANTRTGWQKFEAGADKIYTDPTDGQEYNVTKMLSQLYSTSDEAEVKELTQELMTLANHLCGYYSVLEKTAPFRIYDPKLSLADTELNAVQQNFIYYGNINNIIAKMLLADEIYFVK